MKSRLSRLVAVAAVTLFAMGVTTGSTQAQQGGERGGGLKDALTNSVEPPRERVNNVRIGHQLCEELIHPPTPSKA